jgi:hypothetical protein
MTDIKFGEPIRVNGVQPEWLRDEVGLFENSPARWLGGVSDRLSNWEWSRDVECPISIRLPANHPYYTVQAYNAEHGTNFTYWPGGDAAPDDWDGGEVLYGDGTVGLSGDCWKRIESGSDTVGYIRKYEPSVNIEVAYPLHTDPQPDNFTNESPIRAFTDWQAHGRYALGKGFRPSMAHLTRYLDAMQEREGWALVQVLEAATSAPSFLFRRAYP